MVERISGMEETIEEIDTLVKENNKSKKLQIQKNLENLRHYEKTKYMNNRNRGRIKKTQA